MFSYTHDFILADNRHYSYYYFKKIFNIFHFRTLLIVGLISVLSIILSNININSKLIAWFICSFLAIVPSKLFEFRYFSLSTIILLLLVKDEIIGIEGLSLKKCLYSKVNLIWIISINCVTLFMFIYKPFVNSYFESDYSRFMW